MTTKQLCAAAARVAVLGLTSVVAACAAGADEPRTQITMPAEAPPESVPAVRDEAAIAALTRMSGFLRNLQTFEIVATTEKDEVLDDGQKLQFGGTTTYRLRRPDRMFVQLESDRKVRQLYYNGSTVTVAAPRMGMYAVFDAPQTIAGTIDLAEDKYDIDIPLADLFRWGTEQIPADAVQGARVVGYARIDGADTDHYAFRGAEVDWQIWIQRGDHPFPLKVVITSVGEDQIPQYTAELKWKVVKTWPDSTFVFVPPKGAAKISVADAAEVDDASQESGETP